MHEHDEQTGEESACRGRKQTRRTDTSRLFLQRDRELSRQVYTLYIVRLLVYVS